MGNVAATTGIRGLNEEILATASPNLWPRLQRAKITLRCQKVEAEKFALHNSGLLHGQSLLKEPVMNDSVNYVLAARLVFSLGSLKTVG